MGRPAKYEAPALRQKPGGIWEVVWQDRITGDRRRKSTGTPDKAKAEAARRKIESELLIPQDESRLISDLIDKYLQNLARTKPDRNHVPAENSLRPVKVNLGHLTAEQLSQDHVDDYAQWRRTNRRWEGHKAFDGKDTGTIAESTINKDLRMLRACLNDSAARRYIKTAVNFRNPASAGFGRDQWFTQAEVKRMLDVCEASERRTDETGKVIYRQRNREHLSAFILIAVTTAARKEAILSLKWDQVHLPRVQDHNERVFEWDGTVNVGGAYIDFGEARGNKRRPKFPIKHSKGLMRYMLFGGDREQPYVISYKGERIADVKKGIAEVAKEAGIKKKITPHMFKHSAITWMMQSTMPLASIADLTKTSEKVLREYYGHHRPDYSVELGLSVAGLE